MGWSYEQGATKQDVIKERTKSWNGVNSDGTNTGNSYVCLSHTLRGQTLWSVWERTSLHGEVIRFIGCDLLNSHLNYGWGYKSMCESSGPYFYDCPLSYLDMVPVADQEWRDKVRSFHNEKNRKSSLKKNINVGDTISLVNCKIPNVRIVKKNGTKLIGEYNGIIYKIPPRLMGERIS